MLGYVVLNLQECIKLLLPRYFILVIMNKLSVKASGILCDLLGLLIKSDLRLQEFREIQEQRGEEYRSLKTGNL